jgi:hypothetical protein
MFRGDYPADEIWTLPLESGAYSIGRFRCEVAIVVVDVNQVDIIAPPSLAHQVCQRVDDLGDAGYQFVGVGMRLGVHHAMTSTAASAIAGGTADARPYAIVASLHRAGISAHVRVHTHARLGCGR